MQQEMSRYYTVATFSGIPDRQKAVTCSKDKNKDENQDVAVAENMNWMQALRYVGAKGHQKAIIVYQIRCSPVNMTRRQKYGLVRL